ncbi:MAG: prepilin-type N-terminal cleavage/methylation domain-containing protein [Candidatus Omnitrophica bacterium]|nr:prepilin-type N-terminal cleavage/methylation domain-containing protein [Candidatus Omnitrophota bacterium]
MKHRLSGFTLMEIIIAIIMVTVLASLAFINYGTVIEKSRAKEAEGMLIAIFSNVQRVKVETGTIAGVIVGGIDPFANGLQLSENFQPVNAIFAPGIPSLTYTITRTPPLSYTLNMVVINTTVRPNITCSGGPAGLCTRLGY